jgi:hypothetical protein
MAIVSLMSVLMIGIGLTPEALSFALQRGVTTRTRQTSVGQLLHHRMIVKLLAKESFASENDSLERINGGENHLLKKLVEADVPLAASKLLPEAPPFSYDKYLTMQEKRVVVTVRYSGGAGLKPYFLTVAKKLKLSNPDVVLERRILPTVSDVESEATFEVLVDKKVVVGNGRIRKQKVGNVDTSHGRSVFVSMQELDLAICRARRRRRPSTLYGELNNPAGLETLRKTKGTSADSI